MESTKYKILLVEDNKLDQMAFMRMVEDEELSYDCKIADSVLEARDVLANEQFDVVITDYSLGDGTAFDILDLVRDTPIILVTGAGGEEVAIKAWRAGAYDYLTKDFEQGYLKAVPITVENAVEHGKMEDILNRKQKNLEAIFDAVPVGMLLVDKDMVVKRVNDAIRQMVHKEFSQIINNKVGGAIGCANSTFAEAGCGNSPACEKCPLQRAIKSVFSSEQPVRGIETQPILEVGGKELRPWLSVSVEPVDIDGSRHAVVAVSDVTERKMAEEKLKETMAIKSQFISTVSHELRTPLGCMKNAISNILDGAAGKISDQQRNFLDIAKRNIDRLSNLINDVLDFQKLEAGRMEFNVQENDIAEVVGDVHKIMTSSAEEKGIDFSLELGDDLPKARFDGDKIVQVMTNLVSNAIKFTPQKGRVSVSASRRDEELVMRVSDTGMGIPKDDLSRIFDRFYRVHRPGKEISGTGLGLAIVNKIVRAHGGRIEVESEIDRGTTFSVFLPLDVGSIPVVLPGEMDEVLETTVAD